MANPHFPPPPIFGVHGNEDSMARNGIISLVDIFDDFLFANDRSGSSISANTAAASHAPYGKDHDEDDDDEDDFSDDSDGDGDGDGKRRKRPRGLTRAMTEEQKVERRYYKRITIKSWKHHSYFCAFETERGIGNMRSDHVCGKSFYWSPCNTAFEHWKKRTRSSG